MPQPSIPGSAPDGAARVPFLLILLVPLLAIASSADEATVFRGPPFIPAARPTTPIVGDLDLDGRADVFVLGRPTSSLFLGGGSNRFSRTSTVSVSSQYGVCTIGTFSEDANPDVVVIDPDTELCIVLDGDGQGGLTIGATIPLPPAGANLNPRASVVSGDFDEDGHLDQILDLVVVHAPNPTAGRVDVLLGNGDLTFSAAGSATVGRSAWSLAIDDFDGDSHLDAAVTNDADDDLSVLFGDGQGNLSGSTRYPLGNFPRGLVSADLDGDGDIDLAASSSDQGQEVSILLNDGAGTFSHEFLATPEVNANGITGGDFDLDGDIDLVVTHFNSFSLLSNDGQGGFPAISPTSTLSAGPGAPTAVDIDRDGSLDLVTDGTGGVMVFRGDGAGSFGPPEYYLAAPSWDLACGDLDGDRLPDLCVTQLLGNDIVFLFNRSIDPESCRQGTVDRSTGSTSDVLFVNGSSGLGPERRVTVGTGQPIQVSLESPTMGPFASGRYALYAWIGDDLNPVQSVVGGRSLGCWVGATPLHPMISPGPFRCFRAAAMPRALCRGLPDRPAPPSFPFSLTKGNGLATPTTFSLQSWVEDHSVPAGPRFSVSNAVTVDVQ